MTSDSSDRYRLGSVKWPSPRTTRRSGTEQEVELPTCRPRALAAGHAEADLVVANRAGPRLVVGETQAGWPNPRRSPGPAQELRFWPVTNRLSFMRCHSLALSPLAW